jgi:hypothetical protein
MDQITQKQTIPLNTKTFNWNPEIIQVTLLILASLYFLLVTIALFDGSFRLTYHFFYFIYAAFLFLPSFIYFKKSAISPKVPVNHHHIIIKTGIFKRSSKSIGVRSKTLNSVITAYRST